MAKDIDITLPDGGEITVPGWSTEETQKQIMNILKSMEGVDKDTVKKLEQAQRSDDKNSKKEIEALKDLSKDLKASNKMGFLGALGVAAGAAGSALGGIGTVVGVTAGAVAVMGTALVAGAKAATNIATAYTDAIKPLAETGIAFGDMGSAVNQSVMDLNSLGFSSAEAAKLINNSGTAFLRMGAEGLADFTKTMRVSGKEFARFGMTTEQATEYVATEMEERARAGIVDKLSATQMANLQMNILNDQIKATKRLGKSIDEIADFQKQVKDDPRIAGIINAFSGDEEQRRMINSLITQLGDVPGLDGTDVADIISAEMEGRSIESTEAYRKVVVALSQTPGALETFTTSVGESFRAVAENNTKEFESASNKFDKNLSNASKTIYDIQQRALQGDADARSVITTLNTEESGGGRAFVGQAAVISGMAERIKETKQELDEQGNVVMNDLLKKATDFDNTIIKITAAFTEQMTRSQQAMVEGLDAVTTSLTKSGLEQAAVDIAQKLGDMAKDGITTVTTNMGTLADKFVTFSQELQKIYGEEGIGGVAERIYQASVDNIVKPIADAILGLFTNPTVVTALVAAMAIPFGAQVVAMAAGAAITKAILDGKGSGVDGVVPGGEGGPEGKGKGSRFGGRGARGLIAGGAGAVMAGAMEIFELMGDLDDINKDLKDGSITRSEAQIAKSTESGEAAGGMAGAAGGAAAGAAAGTMIMPGVGTAIGALLMGGIGWWAGRAGARQIGETLGEAVFTPEQEALEAELLKIEERLSGNINRRTRAQLETRKKLVEAELELMKPLEQAQPVNPYSLPIMTTPPTDEEEESKTSKPTSTDGTPTQSVDTKSDDAMTKDLIEKLYEVLDEQKLILTEIKTNTKNTSRGINELGNT